MNPIHNTTYKELELLQAKIRANTAISEDYRRYEELLTDNGISYQQIRNALLRHGFVSVEDFHLQRNRATTPDQRYIIEGAAGTLLGLSEGLMMYWRVYGKKPQIQRLSRQ